MPTNHKSGEYTLATGNLTIANVTMTILTVVIAISISSIFFESLVAYGC